MAEPARKTERPQRPSGSGWNQGTIDEFRAKGGKGVSGFGDRLLLLHTRGAKTGEERVTPVAYHRDGNRYVIAASMGGAPWHPQWYHNLLKNPDTTIEVGTEKLRMHATPIPRGAERDRLYEAHAALMPGFREYPSKTRRIIPVVVLEQIKK